MRISAAIALAALTAVFWKWLVHDARILHCQLAFKASLLERSSGSSSSDNMWAGKHKLLGWWLWRGKRRRVSRTTRGVWGVDGVQGWWGAQGIILVDLLDLLLFLCDIIREDSKSERNATNRVEEIAHVKSELHSKRSKKRTRCQFNSLGN